MGTLALIAQPFASDHFTEVDAWTNGDQFTVYRPVQIYFNEMSNTTVDTVWLLTSAGWGEVATVLNVTVEDSIIDANALIRGDFAFFINSFSPGGIIVRDGSVAGGSTWSPGIEASSTGSSVGSDAILHVEPVFAGTGENRYGAVYLAGGTIAKIVGGYLLPGGGDGEAGTFYGPSWQIDLTYARLEYGPSAASAFAGPSIALTMFGGARGTAIDRTARPSQYYSGIALTPGNLDLPVASGGFGGIAVDNSGTYGLISVSSGGDNPAPAVSHRRVRDVRWQRSR